MPAGLPDLAVLSAGGTINACSPCSMYPALTFGSAGSAVWPAAQLVILVPFTIERSVTIKRIVAFNWH